MPETDTLPAMQSPAKAQDTASKTHRTHCFAYPPAAYEIAPHDCGRDDAQWSEFQGHLWCEHCQVDFIPTQNGVFDGPIPIRTAAALGIRLDRIDLATGKLDLYDIDNNRYESEAPAPA